MPGGVQKEKEREGEAVHGHESSEVRCREDSPTHRPQGMLCIEDAAQSGAGGASLM